MNKPDNIMAEGLDKLSRADRSRNMAAIKTTDTKPERMVRSVLHRMGYRFRLQRRIPGVDGTPDIVLPGRRKVVLVHGCFWHRHAAAGCRKGRSVPTARRAFWESKFAANVKRDRRTLRQLRRRGWAVMVVWECRLRDPEGVARRLRRFLG